jgi:large repetitive protein
MPTADLSVTVTDNTTSVVPGTSDAYTITITNNGPDTVSSITLTDTIPAALLNPAFNTFGLGSYDPATGIWSGLNLASGQSVSIQLSGTVDPYAIASTGSFTNIVTVAPPGGTTDSNTANNTASDTDNITPEVDLSVTVTDGVTAVVPGTPDRYTITLENIGPSAVTSVTLTDATPAALLNPTFNTFSQGSYDPVSGLWSGLNLRVGSVSIEVSGTIDPSAPASIGSFTNTITVSQPAGVTDTNSSNNTVSDFDDVTPQADLLVAQTVNDATPIVGEQITYTITLSNNGPSTATGVVVNDLLPAGVSFAAGSVDQGSYDPNTGVWIVGTVSPGSTETLTIIADVISPAAQTNTATASQSGASDPDTSNDSASVTETPPLADLAVTVTDNVTSVIPGTSDTYTITVFNNGPDTVSSINLTDTLPVGLLNATFNSFGLGSYDPVSGLWSGLNLASGQSVSMTLRGMVDPNAPAGTGTFTNVVTVSAPRATDTNTFNNTASDFDNVTPQADLLVTKTVSDTTPNVGEQITYTITLTNNGPSAATNVNVSDLLPAGVSFAGGSVGQGSYDSLTGIWTVGALSPGSTATLMITGTVISPNSQTNTATVTADQVDPNTANNSASATETPPAPTLSTTPAPAAAILGLTPVTLTDTAVLAGGSSPAGSITFTLVGPGGITDTETVTVSGDGTYTTPTGFTLPNSGTVSGTYQWNASYSGDANNVAVSDINNPSEQVTVNTAQPTLSTTPSRTTVTLGSTPVTLTDTAVLVGAFNPSGTITFTLFHNGGNTPVDTETVAINGNGSYTTPTGYTLPSNASSTGSYQWDATYSGDSNNNPASDLSDPTEQVTVGPLLSTTPTPATVTLGPTPVTLTDTVDLTGASSPTGSITFTLVGPGGITDTETVTVNGDGSYSTPTGFTLPNSGTVTGTYQWSASYSGDANNIAVSETNNPGEQVTVSAAFPTLSTTPSPVTATLGPNPVTLTDSADLENGFSPTGTITFQLFHNGGVGAVDTETVTVNGDGTYTTPTGFTLPNNAAATGTYQWAAFYSGDPNNLGVIEIKNANEQVTVDAALILSNAGNIVSYTERQTSPSAVMVDSGITVSDSESSVLESATVLITGGALAGDVLAANTTGTAITAAWNGTNALTLTGSDTVADYQQVLRSVGFASSSHNPTDGGADPSRTVTWTATDNLGSASSPVTSTIDVTAVDDPPVLANVAATARVKMKGQAITLSPGLTVSDADNTTLASATVQVTGGTGDVLGADITGTGIAAAYNSATETLQLSGPDTLAHYQQVLDTVTFNTTGPGSPRTVTWVLNDGSASNNLSAPATTTVIPGITPDNFSGTGMSGVLWRQGTTESLLQWSMNGPAVTASQANTYLGTPILPDAFWNELGTANFNGDGKTDILWQHNDGALTIWSMNGSVITDGSFVTYQGQTVHVGPSWTLAGTGDFNGDGKADTIWRNSSGALQEWLMNGTTIMSSQAPTFQGQAISPDQSWSVVAMGDFDGDGHQDILWRNSNGSLQEWLMNGSQITSSQAPTFQGSAVSPDASWSVIAAGDFNGDGMTDLLWRQSTTGSLMEWQMNGAQISSSQAVTFQGKPLTMPDASWSLVEIGDFNGDGMSDALWRQSTTGALSEWLMNGSQITSASTVTSQSASVMPDASWQVQSKPTNFA